MCPDNETHCFYYIFYAYITRIHLKPGMRDGDYGANNGDIMVGGFLNIYSNCNGTPEITVWEKITPELCDLEAGQTQPDSEKEDNKFLPYTLIKNKLICQCEYLPVYYSCRFLIADNDLSFLELLTEIEGFLRVGALFTGEAEAAATIKLTIIGKEELQKLVEEEEPSDPEQAIKAKYDIVGDIPLTPLKEIPK
jgi:hypothetical protein